MPHITQGRLITLVAVVFLFLSMMGGHILTEPPTVRPHNNAQQFDTDRAIERITRILNDEVPHPVDTPENAAVRARLIEEINALGLTPTVTTAPGCWAPTDRSTVTCATVTNVSFRLGPDPVPGEKNTILATTHYDSVPAGPGAADAKIGVATLLEAAHHLSREPLARPILFLITDGEENGLLGAHAFAEQDPRAAEIDVVVNFEARGVGGPAYMFETSQPNGDVIPAYMHSVKRPVANSLFQAIYERLPNSTDVAVYLPMGWKALNFAVIKGEVFYHTPGDNLENLSPRSVQHMGDAGLSLLRTLSRENPPTHKGRLIYTDIFGRGMIALPEWLSLLIMIVAALVALTGFTVHRNKSEEANTPLYRLRIVAMPLLAMIAAGIIGFVIQYGVNAIRPEPDYWRAHGWASQGWAVLSAMVAITLVPFFLCRKADRVQIYNVSWMWFSLIGIAVAILLSGAAILFVPVAILFIASLIGGYILSPIRMVLGTLAAFITLIIWAPNIAAIGNGLGYGAAIIITIMAIIALLPWAAIILPARDDDKIKTLAQWAGPPLIIGLIIFTGLSITLPAYTPKAPRHFNISTLIDQAHQKAWVMFGNGDLPPSKTIMDMAEITAPSTLIAGLGTQSWSTPIEMPDLSPIGLTILDDTQSNHQRTVTVRLSAPSRDRIRLLIPAQAQLQKINYQGLQKAITAPTNENGFYSIRCDGQSCDGQIVELVLGQPDPITLFMISGQFSTSKAARPFTEKRPTYMVPRQNGDQTITVYQTQL